jgi:hypothetical protein
MNQVQLCNTNLIYFLYRKYFRRNWKVYTDSVAESFTIPESWKGPHPDLIITKKESVIAICIESYDSLDESKVVDKWKSITENHVTKLRIIVREDEELDIARSLVEKYTINAECVRIKRRSPDRMRIKVKTKKKPHSNVDWVIVFSSLLIISVCHLLFGLKIVVGALFVLLVYYLIRKIVG